MRAGALDRQIVIEEAVETQDSTGQPVSIWMTYAVVWAQAQPLRGRERFLAQQVVAEVDTRFRIRFLRDVTPKMRIRHDGRVFDISAVLEIGRREGLEILATIKAEPQP